VAVKFLYLFKGGRLKIVCGLCLFSNVILLKTRYFFAFSLKQNGLQRRVARFFIEQHTKMEQKTKTAKYTTLPVKYRMDIQYAKIFHSQSFQNINKIIIIKLIKY
jgi:hypothetical protein